MGIEAAFFAVNSGKLNALIGAVTSDFAKAEHAVLRRASDMYRKTIFNAQVYLNTGAGSLRQAVDMAAKDFIASGINCVQYKNGAIVNIASYAEMALRTANKRANMVGAGEQRDRYGIHTVFVSAHGSACPSCAEWQGKVYIDDVYSGGTAEESKESGYPLLSTAIDGGMFHPNCRNGMSLWIEGINTTPTPPTAERKKEQAEKYRLQQEQRYNERQIRKYKRLANFSPDPESREKYSKKLAEWQKKQRELIKANPDKLRRKYDREKIYGTGLDNGETEKSSRLNNPTTVNQSVIGSAEYRAKFNGITDSTEGDAAICKKAKDILSHRNNTYFEDMYLFDSNGNVVGAQTHSDTIQEVVYNKSLNDAIKKHSPKSLISLHNHPESKPPSGADLCSCGRRKYKKGVICCHNGDIFIYQSGNKPFTAKLFDDTVDKYKKRGYNEVGAYERALQQFSKDYGIKWEVR